jgi:hypothetical protein
VDLKVLLRQTYLDDRLAKKKLWRRVHVVQVRPSVPWTSRRRSSARVAMDHSEMCMFNGRGSPLRDMFEDIVHGEEKGEDLTPPREILAR